MKVRDGDVERAQALIAAEVATSAAAVAAALAGEGSPVCTECGDPIEAARRRAMPSARLCLDCQSRAEREKSRR